MSGSADTPSAIASYFWSGPNGFSSTAAGNTLTAQSANSGVYQLTVTATNGCQGIVSTTINVLPNPTVAASGATVCYGSSAVLTATGGAFFTWRGPNNFVSANVTPNCTVAIANSISSGNYTVTGVSFVNTCSTAVVVGLATLTVPVVTTTNITVCSGQPATITANGASSYTWSGPNVFSSLSASALIPVTNNFSSGVYTVQGTSINSCTNLAVATLSALPVPTLSAVGATVCLSQPAGLSVTGAQSYSWTGPAGFNSGTQNIVVPLTNLSTAGIYTVVGTAANSCTSAAMVSLSALPLPTIVCAGTVVCYGQTATLTSIGTAVNNYQWSGPNSFTSVTSNAFIPIVNNLSIGVYTLTGISANLCAGSTTVPLSAIPVPILSVTGATNCSGTPTVITVTGAALYTWAGPTSFSASGSSILILSVDAQTSGIYTVMGTGLNTCANTATISVMALPLPTVTATGATVCLGNQATLGASGATSYLWSGPGGYNAAGSNPVVPITTIAGAQAYSVTGIASNSCSATASINLFVLPLPQVFINPTSPLICAGQSLTLAASGAQSYTWMPVGLPPTSAIVVTPATSSSYTVLGVGLNGCLNTAAISILVSACTGINENLAGQNSFFVYPNPNAGNFVVTSRTAMQLLLVNTFGQKIRTIDLDEKNSYNVSVSDIAAGIYFLISKDHRVSQKIVIEK